MLKERGYYTIKTEQEEIPVRFCTGAFKLFCEKKDNIGLQGMYNLILTNLTIGDLALLLYCAAEYVAKKEKRDFEYEEEDALDWIDLLGGITPMLEIVTKIMSDPTEEVKEEKEGKKKREKK